MKVDKYIEIAYDRMKQHIRRFAEGRGLPFSEDIYHDTLLKMRQIEEKKGGKMDDDTERGLDNYLFMAYRTNALRELQYPRIARTTYTDQLPEREEAEYDEDTPSSRLEDYFRNKYGDKLTDLYLRRAANERMRTLIAESGIKDLAHQFKVMADDARNNRQYIMHGIC